MKLHACIALLFLLSGCGSSPGTHDEQVERGWMSRTTLAMPAHHVFQSNYDSTHIDRRFVPMIAQVDQGVDIVVIMGTWCSDSKREVPRFLKIADSVGIPPERIKLYGVDRTKKGDDGVPQSYGIELVPTFIFLKDGKEIGRIVETPRTTLEGDMLAIMAGAR